MVAALPREVSPLVKSWRKTDEEVDGYRLTFFEGRDRVLVCGGIGREAARRAAEAVITRYRPAILQSVGFAGALDPGLKVGDLFFPARVIDSADNSRMENDQGEGCLVSFHAVAGIAQKARLAKAYSAQAVDMEAAGVASAAQAHGLKFQAVKVISDELDFEMPLSESCITSGGGFLTGRFLAMAGLRPWLWPRVFRLARNTSRASRNLCRWLAQYDGQHNEAARPAPLASGLGHS